MFCNFSSLHKLDSKVDLPHLKLVVVFDEVAPEKLRIDRAGVKVMTFSQFLSFGQSCPNRDFPTRGPDDLFTIIYTSGSTGKPKGWLSCFLAFFLISFRCHACASLLDLLFDTLWK